MLTRIVVGAILIAFAAGVFLLDWHLEQLGWPKLAGGPGGRTVVIRALPLAGLMLLLLAAGHMELARLSAAGGVAISRFAGAACAVVLGTLPCWRQGLFPGGDEGLLGLVVLGVMVMAVFADQALTRGADQAFGRIGRTLLAVCYLGVCGAVVLSIRLHFGLKAFVLFILAVKFTDIGAYFVGSAIGRHKLLPSVSPHKSWEGLFGGLVLGAIAAAAFASAVNPVFDSPARASMMNMGWPAAAAFGAAIGVFGQVGDLCESVLKRDARVKDAGSVAPGFGGVLDILDSPLLAAPAAYVLLALFR